MSEPYVHDYRARWADMDFNQHMRNAAYLGVAEETRLRFLETNGWSMAEFSRRRLGPVVSSACWSPSGWTWPSPPSPAMPGR
jgi:acyl-CoA thioesterase FadM